MTHFAHLFAHVVAFGAWMGLCVALSVLARGAQRMNDTMEVLLRSAIVVILPTGYSAARELGVVLVPDAFFLALWIISGAWLLLVLAGAIVEQPAWKKGLVRADVGWSLFLAAGLAWDALQGSRGRGHLFAGWVVSKFGLLSVALVASAILRLRVQALAWPALLGLLAIALAATWLGIAKPVI